MSAPTPARSPLEAVTFAVELHRRDLLASNRYWDAVAWAYYFEPLRGRDLACWCDPADPCHADTLLQLANEGRPR